MRKNENKKSTYVLIACGLIASAASFIAIPELVFLIGGLHLEKSFVLQYPANLAFFIPSSLFLAWVLLDVISCCTINRKLSLVVYIGLIAAMLLSFVLIFQFIVTPIFYMPE